MSTRNLEALFRPRTVAVVGASSQPERLGAVALRNLAAGGFQGAILPVNPKHASLNGLTCYPGVGHLPQVPDLAVIATPPAAVPGIVAELGRLGTRAAVVLSAGITESRRLWGKSLRQRMLVAARPHMMRIVGPNCVGVLVPALGLNASAAHIGAQPGKLAFVAQSGALALTVLDWAASRGIGFSKFVAMGDAADVDFGDVLDYLASDPQTQAILLFIESLTGARKFMSAARAASRNKPVLAVKAGRAPEGAQVAALHTGVLAGPDEIYDAAIRRAGMLRVLTMEDLFDAVETLARAKAVRGDRLAIVTNGGGPGVMATDALVSGGGRLARFDAATLERLRHCLPPGHDCVNPLDILGDAPAERHADVLRALVGDAGSDATLVIHAPSAISEPVEIARAVAQAASGTERNVLACWLGGDAAAPAREVLAQAGVPAYDTPEKAVRAFLQIVQYRRNQDMLMQVPRSVSEDLAPDITLARWVVRGALAHGRELLSEPEAKSILRAYGIAVVETRVARSAEEAVRFGRELGFPVALKIVSHEVVHKTEVGGVALHLSGPEEVRSAARTLRKRLRALRPEARLRGFAVQRMARLSGAHELIAGAASDPVFGPVVLFGHGGTAVELTADRAVALPPLDHVLARDLVSRTRVARLLAGYAGHPPADLDAVYVALMRVARIVTDIPEIVELDINPLLADEHGVVALDARMRVAPVPKGSADRLAIRPYPSELEEEVTWQGRRLLLRPIRPEDGEAHRAFFAALAPEDVRMRLFTHMREIPSSQLARMTQIDYDREMAFIATAPGPDGVPETLGDVRAVTDPDNIAAEFAITIRSDIKGKGLGPMLLQRIIDYCRARGTQRMVGETLVENDRLQNLVRRFGFRIERSGEPGVMRVELDLAPARR